jgi:hypothetical protein
MKKKSMINKSKSAVNKNKKYSKNELRAIEAFADLLPMTQCENKNTYLINKVYGNKIQAFADGLGRGDGAKIKIEQYLHDRGVPIRTWWAWGKPVITWEGRIQRAK